MHVPSDIALRAILKRGLVVRIKGDIPFTSEHYHHFIILNYDPTTETVIVVVHATHQVERECLKAEKQGEDVNKTVVVFGPQHYDFFPRQTAFNCNETHELSFDSLVRALEQQLLEIPPDDILTGEDIQLLCKGVLASKQTPPYVARLLLP